MYDHQTQNKYVHSIFFYFKIHFRLLIYEMTP